MSYGVRILDTTQITLPPLPHPPPPPAVKLSFLDAFWVMFPPVQKLLIYSNPVADLPFPLLLQALKSSLSYTLLDHLPLSGKLTYNPTSEEAEIDLSHLGVTFVEAESDLDLHQLAANEVHDVKSFIKLVPEIDVTVLPFGVFAVQVTRFCCGGIVIGYTVHHAVVDGKAMYEFIETWASACRAKLSGTEVELVQSERHKPPPYDRSVIQYPKGDEISKKFLQSISTNFPFTGVPSAPIIQESRLVNRRRTFVLDAPTIQSLKRRATQSQPPSTFVVVAAYTWICYVRTKSLDPNLETVFALLMDCRTRLKPPVDEDYFANCLNIIFTATKVSELIGEDGLARACTVLRERIRCSFKDPLSGIENLVDILKSFIASGERVFNVSASPKFRVYETDFGLGKPIRFESVSMNRDGEFALVGGKDEGSVQVSVVVSPSELEVFQKFFLDGLSF